MGSAAGLSSISIYAHLILGLSTTKSEGEDGHIYGGVGVVGTAAWHACGVFLSLHVKQEEIEDMVVGGGGGVVVPVRRYAAEISGGNSPDLSKNWPCL